MYCIAADSDAVDATTIVWSKAPCSSNFFTTLDTEDAFWPIAT